MSSEDEDSASPRKDDVDVSITPAADTLGNDPSTVADNGDSTTTQTIQEHAPEAPNVPADRPQVGARRGKFKTVQSEIRKASALSKMLGRRIGLTERIASSEGIKDIDTQTALRNFGLRLFKDFSLAETSFLAGAEISPRTYVKTFFRFHKCMSIPYVITPCQQGSHAHSRQSAETFFSLKERWQNDFSRFAAGFTANHPDILYEKPWAGARRRHGHTIGPGHAPAGRQPVVPGEPSRPSRAAPQLLRPRAASRVRGSRGGGPLTRGGQGQEKVIGDVIGDRSAMDADGMRRRTTGARATRSDAGLVAFAPVPRCPAAAV